MPTWKNQFSELSTKHSTALEEVKRAKSKEQWTHAISKVKMTTDAISTFLREYDSAGSPSHDEQMPNG